jgi:hypothetical protein
MEYLTFDYNHGIDDWASSGMALSPVDWAIRAVARKDNCGTLNGDVAFQQVISLPVF